MTELEKAARMALEFCELCWRDVAMNDYALEKLEQTTATLTQALATTEPVAERDLLRRILANHDGAMRLIGARMRAAGVSNMTIHGEERGYFWQAYSLMEEARALLTCTATAERKGEPIGEIVRSFGTGSGLEVRLFGGLTSDTPGIVGTKLYTSPQETERKGEPVAWMNDEGDMELSHKPWMSSVWKPLYTSPQVPEDVIAILDECRTALMECDRDCDYKLIERIDAVDAARK